MAQPDIHVPGEAVPGAGIDDVIASSQGGRALKRYKPRAAVAPSPVSGDPERPAEAAVNAQREMGYAEACALLEAGKLSRSVLTEQGWVIAPMRTPPSIAQRV